MDSMNENIINIKSKVMQLADDLVGSIDDAFLNGTSAHHVEKEVFSQVLMMGHQAMTLLFTHYGIGDVGEKAMLEDGSEVKRLPKLHSREYLSIFGLLTFERTAYGTREGQKIEYIPMDARLELPRHKFSYLLQDWNQALATEMPYSKVNDTLSNILNLSVPVNSLERNNQNMNKYTEGYWDNQIEIKIAKEEQFVVASSDCKGVVIRKSQEEKEQYLSEQEDKRKPACVENSTSKKQTGKKKMAVLGAVYTVAENIRSPEQVLESLFRSPEDISPYTEKEFRPKPLDKHIRASMHRDDKDTLFPARKEIFDGLEQECNERNPEGKSKNIFLMDGEEKLWSMGGDIQVKGEVIEILDIIHACSYIWSAVQALHPENKVNDNIPLVKEQIARLLDNGIAIITRSLRWQATYLNIKGSNLKKINTACTYLEKNSTRMQYKDYLEAGYPIATGVIEGACRNVVVDRMEHSGMRWVMDGAKSMLNIRCIHLNGNWDDFIPYYIKEEQKDIYPKKAANEDSFIERMVA